MYFFSDPSTTTPTTRFGKRKLQEKYIAELGFANLCQVLVVIILKSAWNRLDFALDWV